MTVSRETMIERVARAIEIALMAGISGKYDHALTQDGRPTHISAPVNSVAIARAALEAMREPTPLMLECGDVVIPSGFHWMREGAEISGTETIYRAMIDAALSEKP